MQGFIARKTTIGRKHEINLLVCVLILSMASVIDFADAASKREVNCRKYVHAPECRGIAAKRDTRAHQDYRLPPDEDREMPSEIHVTDNMENRDNLMNNRRFMNDLLRKIMAQRNADLDAGTYNNYLK